MALYHVLTHFPVFAHHPSAEGAEAFPTFLSLRDHPGEAGEAKQSKSRA